MVPVLLGNRDSALGVQRDECSGRITSNRSSSDPAQIDDTAIVRGHADFEPDGATARPIDEKATAAIHASNVPETATAQNYLAVPTRDGPAIVEVSADAQVDRGRLGGRRQCRGHDKAENET
jgi:hypothetical protein